ncbi:membrane-associated protein, putative [Bodo saltans]|uniref:Membrane-associated protein, putative n=1 Tax=Bodo saltans TaxID=75058 RepID=A0A0S4JFA2_BODSA|nr:membrane-associated protein, putative [Bodo saltans]|eukprot:CUG88832.1 membrane-associated protein, putative [Bodo saltans]
MLSSASLSYCVFGTTLLVLLLVHHKTAEAGWTVTTISPPPSVVLREDFISGNKVSISFISDSAQFSSTLSNARDVFMTSCASSVPNRTNPYGFDRWKSFFTSTRTVDVARSNGQDSNIILTFPQQAYGYTITQSEFISCQVSTSYVTLGNLGSDTTISFAVVANFNGVQARLLTKNDTDPVQRQAVYWVSLPNPYAAQYTESTIRRDGLMLMITVINDAWNVPTVPATFIANFSCNCPGDDSACPQILPWVRGNSAYVSYNPLNDPRTVRLEVPRTVTRLFNTKGTAEICLIINPNITYGFKRVTIIGASVDTCFSLLANTFTSPPLFIAQLLRNSTSALQSGEKDMRRIDLAISEACIRGRSNDIMCGLSFYFYMDYLSPQNFVTTAMALADLQQVAFLSLNMNLYLNLVSSISTIQQQVGTVLVDVNLLAARQGDPRYQIDTTDTIQVRLPFSCLSSLEAPANIVTLTVTPSPGDLIGSISNIVQQSQFWAGGFQWALRMGGERWVSNVITNVSVLITEMIGNRGVGDANTADTWFDWRSCVLPQGSLAFENVSGAVNQSVLLLNFQACPQYTVKDPNETVTITAQASFGASGLGYNVTQNLTFVVYQSPPSYTVTGQLNFTEDTIQQAAFLLQLQGGSKFKDPLPASCVESLRSSTMTTDEPTDPTAWSNSATRTALLVNAVVGYDTFGIPSKLSLVFNQSYHGYQNLRGEHIRFGLLSNITCVDNYEPVIAGLNYTIFVAPRVPVLVVSDLIALRPGNSNVSGGIAVTNATALSSNATLSPFITSTDIRDATMQIVLQVDNDTFRSSLQPSTVINSIVASSTAQPAGFMALRSKLFSASAAGVSINSTTVVVRFQPDILQYAITFAEIIVISVTSEWVTSEQNVGTLRFRILPTPGEILLQNWTGQALGLSVITEDMVRSGDLWFQFAMIGDQWRQERDPYVAMFSGPTGESTGLLSLVDELVPSIEYFNFTSSDTYQYITLQLQASDSYDISKLETVRIAFSADAASSGLAPQFDLGDGTFLFQIAPSAGRLVASGPTILTEKVLREGGSVVYLTLFGETWTTAAAQCVRNETRLNPINIARNDVVLSSALPTTSFVRVSSSLLAVYFQPAKSYALPTGSSASDMIMLNLTLGRCFLSGLAPPQTPVWIEIGKTRGEMSLQARSVLTPTITSSATNVDSSDLANRELELSLDVSGTSWSLYNLIYNPQDDVNETLHGALLFPSYCATSSASGSGDGGGAVLLWMSCCVSNESCADTSNSLTFNESKLISFLSEPTVVDDTTTTTLSILPPVNFTRNASVVPQPTSATSAVLSSKLERRVNSRCAPSTFLLSFEVGSSTTTTVSPVVVSLSVLAPLPSTITFDVLFTDPKRAVAAFVAQQPAGSIPSSIVNADRLVTRSVTIAGCEMLLQNVSTSISTTTTTRRVSSLHHPISDGGNVTTTTFQNVSTISTVSTSSTRHQVQCTCTDATTLLAGVTSFPLNADDPSTLIVIAGTPPTSATTVSSFTSSSNTTTPLNFTSSAVSRCSCSLVNAHSIPTFIQTLRGAGWLPTTYRPLTTQLASATLINTDRAKALVSSAFTSTASPIEEPAGFATRINTFLSELLSSMMTNISFYANSSTVTFRLNPASDYTIIQDEVVSFTLLDGSYFVDGLLPDPNVASFRVSALPQTLFLVYNPPGGQYSPASVVANVRKVLSMSSGSATSPGITVAQTGRDGAAYQLSLVFNVTPTQDDPRTNTELTNHLISLAPAYLSSTMGVTCAVLNGTPCVASSNGTSATTSGSSSDTSDLALWVILAVIASVLVGGLTYVSLIAQLTTLSGSMRRKHQTEDKIRYVVSSEAEGAPTAGAETAAESVAGPMAVRQSASSLQQRPMSLKEFANQRRLLRVGGGSGGRRGIDHSGSLRSLTAPPGADEFDETFQFSQRDLEDDEEERHAAGTNNEGASRSAALFSSSNISSSYAGASPFSPHRVGNNNDDVSGPPPPSRSLQSVMEEQRRSERVDAALREKYGKNRGGPREIQKALDLRADFQLL